MRENGGGEREGKVGWVSVDVYAKRLSGFENKLLYHFKLADMVREASGSLWITW